jgi:hypothetical protein
MALKPDRNITNAVDISFFMNHVAERGGVVILEEGGSGAAMDQGAALVRGSGAAASGTIPIGLLLNDVVNLDLTRTHINWHKDEVQLGGKVAVLRRGVVVTNVISGSAGVAAGEDAYYTAATFGSETNKFTNVNESDQEEDTRVGRFLSSEDEDGYVKVEINLP